MDRRLKIYFFKIAPKLTRVWNCPEQREELLFVKKGKLLVKRECDEEYSKCLEENDSMQADYREYLLENPLETETECIVFCSAPAEYSWMIKEASQYAVSRNGHTIEDYYALPEDRRTELIDGTFYDMASPTLKHQLVSMQIGYQIQNYITQNNGKCSVFTAPVDVQLDCDDKTMIVPDLIVVCNPKQLQKQCVLGAPDFVAEILSPSTRKRDMFLKLMKYQKAGVREYWMIDTEKERIITYFFEEDDIPVIYGFADKIPVRIYGGNLLIDFNVIEEKIKNTAL